MVVLDSSVIVKWFRPETGSDRARRYRIAHFDQIESIFCPDLLVYELANVAVTNSAVPDTEIRNILETFWEVNIALVAPTKESVLLAAGLAQQYDLTFYDASYLALALTLNCDLVTADEKLVYKVNLPFVKLL